MQIRLTNLDAANASDFSRGLQETLDREGLSDSFRISPMAVQNEVERSGDPVTMAAVLLTAVGTGGALTIAMAKEGFLTRLARVLEALAARKVELTVEIGKKKLHLSGSASHIERLLRNELRS
jgi:hypothetical protein